jgi:membrane-associated phospholipid phosphatase
MNAIGPHAGSRPWTLPARPALATKLVIAWAVAAIHIASYHAVASLSLRPERDFMTPLDERIPFLPWTVWLYMPLWIVFFHVVVVSLQSWGTLLRCVLSVVLASVLAYAAFVLFPSSYPRPELFSDDGPTSGLLLLVWAVDRPNNTFPSLHVALPFVLALACLQDDRRLGRWLVWLALVPSLATLTVKQHYVIDVIGGGALALVVHAAVFPAFRARLRGAVAGAPSAVDRSAGASTFAPPPSRL